jgi:Putative mono-oxygenase ydhR
MAATILQVNFDLDFTQNEEEAATLVRAHKLLDLPGLIWKVWLRDKATNRGGGIYLFEDRASADAWVRDGFSSFKPAWISNLKLEIFAINEEFSAVTGATLGPVLSQSARAAAQ